MRENNDSPRRPADSNRRRMTPKRRRRILEKKYSRLSLYIMVPFFALIIIFQIVFPRSTVSQIEKRYLDEFPTFSWSTYFSGEFTSDVASWFTDTVPFRDAFKNMRTNILSLEGIKSKSSVNFVATDLGLEDIGNVAEDSDDEVSSDNASAEASTENAESTGSAVEKSSAEEEEEDQKDYTAEDADNEITNGILVVYQDGHYRALECFGTESYLVDEFVNNVNTFKEAVGDDINVYSMVVPIACEFYLPANCSGYCQDQQPWFDQAAEGLDSDVNYIDLISVMKKHTEEAIYLRTDHHWAPLGAYYAAKTLAEAAGVPFADLDTYTEVDMDGYVGTMYSYSNDANLLNDPETFTYYMPEQELECDYYNNDFEYQYTGNYFVKDLDTSLAYLTFMGGDEQICKVKNPNVTNGRKLMVIKDSFGNPTIPYYSSSFEEVYVMDLRYVNVNLISFAQSMGITDVVFNFCSETAFGSCMDTLNNIITGNWDVPISDGAPQ